MNCAVYRVSDTARDQARGLLEARNYFANRKRENFIEMRAANVTLRYYENVHV